MPEQGRPCLGVQPRNSLRSDRRGYRPVGWIGADRNHLVSARRPPAGALPDLAYDRKRVRPLVSIGLATIDGDLGNRGAWLPTDHTLSLPTAPDSRNGSALPPYATCG